MLITINDFQAIIKDLCTRHKEIRHHDQNNVAYIPFQSGEDLAQVVNSGASTLVLVARFYGRPAGPSADELQLKQFVQLRFACAAQPDAVLNYSDVIAAAADKSFQIMLDFLAMFRQQQLDDSCGPLAGIEIENASWQELPEQPYLVNSYGWDLSIPFKTDFPEHNADAWLDPE